MTVTLRPYQRDAIDNAFEVFDRGVKNALIVAATGLGKTEILVRLIREWLATFGPGADVRALIVAHRNELLTQAQAKYQRADPQAIVGIYQGARRETHAEVICVSVQSCYPDRLKPDGTLERKGRIRDLPLSKIKIIVVDEAHHAPARTYLDLIAAVRERSTDCVLVGVTATPYRTDGSLGELWNCYLDHDREPALRQGTIAPADAVGAVALKMGIAEGIDGGFLVPFSPRSARIVIDTVDLSKVATSKKTGDFVDDSLAKVMDTPDVRAKVVEKWLEHAGPGTPFALDAGRPTAAFCASVEAARGLAEAFNAVGVKAGFVDGTMPKPERDAVLAAYASGAITILCNCMVLTEGWDAPHTSAIMLVRPTKSKGMFAQQVGRGTRLVGPTMETSMAAGKHDCIVLDFVGASALGLVSLPDLDQPIEIEGVDRSPEQRERDELEEADPLEIEQLVAEGLHEPPMRVLVRGVTEYPVDFAGDSRVAWTIIGDTRVCPANKGLALLVYPNKRYGGFTAIAMVGTRYRVLANATSEAEAVARGTAFALMHGTASYIKPPRFLQRKPASEPQIMQLRRDLDANARMDAERGRIFEVPPGLPDDLSQMSVPQAMAWIAYLHARAIFAKRVATDVDDLDAALDSSAAAKRGREIIAAAKAARAA